MPETEILPAPVLDRSPPAQNSQWDEERAAFHRLMPSLLQTHRNRYVAIYHGKVVEEGDVLIEVARRAYARHGYVPIYVNLVTDRPVPSVRIPLTRSVANGSAS